MILVFKTRLILNSQKTHLFINACYNTVVIPEVSRGSQIIAKVWSEIRGGATQRGGVTQTGEATQRGGVTQIFAAPKFLLAVKFFLLFIIDQHKQKL